MILEGALLSIYKVKYCLTVLFVCLISISLSLPPLSLVIGYFMETIDCDFAYIEHKIYIHKWFIRVLVSDVYWRRKTGDQGRGGGKLILDYPDFNETEDIVFGKALPYQAHL